MFRRKNKGYWLYEIKPYLFILISFAGLIYQSLNLALMESFKMLNINSSAALLFAGVYIIKVRHEFRSKSN